MNWKSWGLALLLLLWNLAQPTPVWAAAPAPLGPTLVAQGPLDPRIGLGHYYLQRQGAQVTATVVAVRSQWPQGPMPELFTVPEGFRPTQAVQSAMQVVRLEGKSVAGTLGMQVTPDGSVTLTGDRAVALLRYTTTLTWTTAEPYLWLAGWHPRGVYRLERRGAAVTATVATTSQWKPLVDRAPRALFTLPAGMRPTTTVHWQATQAGLPRYVFEVTPTGAVSYWNHPLLPVSSYQAENYETTGRWRTTDPPQLVASGAYFQQPVAGGGHYHLLRRGEEVTLTLAAQAAPVPTWVRPDLHRLPTLRIHPSAGIHPVPQPNVYVDPDLVSDSPLVTRLEPGALLQYPILGRSIPLDHWSYFPLSLSYWQIQLPDGRTGWVFQAATEVQGEVREVPVTDRLFDVPPGFVPGQRVTWGVAARPVDAAGQLLGAGPEALALQVTAGERAPQSSYLPRAQVNYASVSPRAAGYFQYETTQRWTVGADVCTRSTPVQAAILAAVAAQLDRDEPTCAAITWADLAALRHLTISLSMYVAAELSSGPWPEGTKHHNAWPRAWDLGGLTGLQSLTLKESRSVSMNWTVNPSLPPGFLTPVPQLQDLRVGRIRGIGPEFLVHTPQLRSLTVALGSDSSVPTLESVPPLALPPGFLAYTPQLQRLHLELEGVKTLPRGFLSHTPQLQELVLVAEDLTHLPANLLSQAPQLQTLRLEVGALQYLPPHFLSQAPQLRSLHLEVGGRQYLPPNLLAHTPQLQTLHLEADRLEHLPPDLLAHTPRLQTLHLEADRLKHLPPDFLTHTPRLQVLKAERVTVRQIPPDLLVHTPHLQTLWLTLARDPHVGAGPSLLEGFLAYTPQLRSLRLGLRGIKALPPAFLSHAPQLQELVLEADDLNHLPERFLAQTPQLQTLVIRELYGRSQGPPLSILPAGFLAQTPQLEHLLLRLPEVRQLPEDFLARAPQLRTLVLNLGPDGAAVAAPSGYLRHTSEFRIRCLAVPRALRLARFGPATDQYCPGPWPRPLGIPLGQTFG